VSDTPRTDQAEYECVDEPVVKLGSVDAEFARQLERELNEANKTITLQHELMTTAEKRGVDKAKEELNEANERIKRLEEAGDTLRQAALGCCDECMDHIGLHSVGWAKAKEVKP
jgi:hypothetical protein